MDTVSQLSAALGLGAASGFRASLTIWLISTMARLHMITLDEPYASLGSDRVFLVFSALAAVEFVALRSPRASRLAKAVHVPVAIAAGALLAGSQFGHGGGTSSTELTTTVLGLTTGGAAAYQIQRGRNRVDRSLTRLGPVGNPVRWLITAIENVFAIAFALIGCFVPLLVPAVLLLVGIAVLLAGRLAAKRAGHWWSAWRASRTERNLYEDPLADGLWDADLIEPASPLTAVGWSSMLQPINPQRLGSYPNNDFDLDDDLDF